MKNHSELIKSVSERTLTAKGYSFLWKCIDIVASKNGVSRYDNRMKDIKEKLSKAITFLIIDKGMNIKEIKHLIEQSKDINLKLK